MISTNLLILRKINKYTQEEVAEKINVSRQAVAKWENGDSLPDINKCMALAQLYNVTLDNLINGTQANGVPMIPPKGKHFFGAVTVGERGQIVIPKKARDVFQIKSGDSLMILGDEAQGGIAVIKAEHFMQIIEVFLDGIRKPNDIKTEEKTKNE